MATSPYARYFLEDEDKTMSNCAIYEQCSKAYFKFQSQTHGTKEECNAEFKNLEALWKQHMEILKKTNFLLQPKRCTCYHQ